MGDQLLVDDVLAALGKLARAWRNEITDGEPHDGYLILQGGIPEVQDFLGKVWR